MSNIEELKPPHTVHDASKAMELARIWLVDGDPHVSISGNLWEDPATWGLMLVDFAKHVANAYEKDGRNRESVLSRILEGFNAEMQVPTDEPKGSVEEGEKEVDP